MWDVALALRQKGFYAKKKALFVLIPPRFQVQYFSWDKNRCSADLFENPKTSCSMPTRLFNMFVPWRTSRYIWPLL